MRSPKRSGLILLLFAGSIGVAGCAQPDDGATAAQASATPSATIQAPSAAPTPSEGELAPGWDASPDTPVTPDTDLTDADLTALLRVTATAPAEATTCQPDQLDITLGVGDAAAGHRFTTILARNISQTACSLRGYPGIGARGQWGSAFLIVAEQRAVSGSDDAATAADPPAVVVAPGASAGAPMEWTGELAGAESEPLSMLVVQTAGGQVPVRVAPVLSEPAGATVDIGMLTSVRVSWWRAVDTVALEGAGADGVRP